MSYDEPTPHEIRISKNLPAIAKHLDRLLIKRTGARCHFLLTVSPERNAEPAATMGEEPVASYVANSDRATSALVMLELIAKWQANGELPPLHELRDAEGRTLEEILGAGTH